MATGSGDRSSYFPAIEKKHGKPAAYWLKELAGLGDAKYAEQIAFLRERHGFSQAHANALVMYARGSTTSRRYVEPETFFRDLGGQKEATARTIFDTITAKFPRLDLVIAWNQPMLRLGKQYVFGLSAAKQHLLLLPLGVDVIAVFADRLTGLATNKKTIKVPVDWKVDKKLLCDLVRYRVAELEA